MSRRQDIQSGEGIALRYPGYGALQYISKSAPAGGETGFAPGCEWFVPTGTAAFNTGMMYTNVGSNGFGTNATATWIENDPSSANQVQLGGGTATMGASGNANVDISSAGKSPSATGLFKILASYTLPANTLNKAGRGIQVTAMGTFGATANNKQIQIVLGATNIAPLVDGTVTLTGGTAIGDTGVLATNAGGWSLTCQIFKYGALNSNTQLSATTGIIGNGTHAGMGSPTLQTFAENTALLLVVVGKATTATTDIVYNFSEVTGFN